ncbi:MAG: NYN domain-containing protein [Bdellovibrionales bacterium]
MFPLFFGSTLRRVHIYIDGNNMLGSLASLGVDGHHFDYRQYFSDLMGQQQKIQKITYYGAVFPQQISKEKYQCDMGFYNFLRSAPQAIEVKLGQFKINDGYPVEKGVDVQLATDLIFNAFYNNYDDAYICSADSDLLPAVREVKRNFKEKKIFAIAAHGRGMVQRSYDQIVRIFPNKAKKYWIRREPNLASLEMLQAKFPPRK